MSTKHWHKVDTTQDERHTGRMDEDEGSSVYIVVSTLKQIPNPAEPIFMMRASQDESQSRGIDSTTFDKRLQPAIAFNIKNTP